jgi:hypothetical protein
MGKEIKRSSEWPSGGIIDGVEEAKREILGRKKRPDGGDG